MSLYKQGSFAGSYQRSPRIEISNPLGGAPAIRFDEEVQVFDGADVIATIPRGSLCAVMADASVQTFDLRNPETDAVIQAGGGSAQGLAVLLYSLYRHLGLIRDGQSG